MNLLCVQFFCGVCIIFQPLIIFLFSLRIVKVYYGQKFWRCRTSLAFIVTPSLFFQVIAAIVYCQGQNNWMVMLQKFPYHFYSL